MKAAQQKPCNASAGDREAIARLSMARFLLVLISFFLPLDALAQSWPTQPVRVMVLMPEIPTVAETGMGLEGLERTLNAELNKMVTKPQIVAKFADLGAEPLGASRGVY